MTTQPAATPLAENPRFANHLRLLRALAAMQRAEAVARDTRQLVARTRPSWAAPAPVVVVTDRSAAGPE